MLDLVVAFWLIGKRWWLSSTTGPWFNRFKVATHIHVKLADFFSKPLPHCQAFGHLFLFELFHKTWEAAVVILKCEDEKTAENAEISASEEEVLFYVSGYIVKSLCKKWKGGNSWDEIYPKLVISNEDCKSSSWLTCKDRGGLLKPSDNMFTLMKSMEIEIRKCVNLASMHSLAMHKNTLRESVSFESDWRWKVPTSATSHCRVVHDNERVFCAENDEEAKTEIC